MPSEMLRLNTSIQPNASPNRLGVIGGDLQGFPNGRRLADDVVDIELQALAGAAQSGQIVAEVAAGDKVDSNDMRFDDKFPYVIQFRRKYPRSFVFGAFITTPLN